MKTWSSFCATFIVMTQSRVKPKSNQTFANQDIMLIPYQCGDGASTRGSGRAPAYLKERALEQELQVPEKAIRWHDTQLICSDVQAPLIEHEILKMIKSLDDKRVVNLINDLRKQTVIRSNIMLKEHCLQAISGGYFPITVGGDHSMVGSFAASVIAHEAYEDCGLLWVDAHADFNTPKTSPSGSLHGMSLAILCGLGDEDYKSLCANRRIINPAHVCVFGARDIDETENQLLQENGVTVITMDEINRIGLDEAAAKAIETISTPTYKMLSFDIDAMDASLVPSTGTPVKDGFDERIFKTISVFKTLDGFIHAAFAELNPTIGTPEEVDKTYELYKRAIKSII